MTHLEHTVDASGKSIGRVATEVAKALMGKMSPQYVPNKPLAVQVTVANASKLNLPEKKRLGKMYTKYSGYPGGLKIESLSNLIARKGHGEAIKIAVTRMLPNNRLRVGRLKRLTINK